MIRALLGYFDRLSLIAGLCLLTPSCVRPEGEDAPAQDQAGQTAPPLGEASGPEPAGIAAQHEPKRAAEQVAPAAAPSTPTGTSGTEADTVELSGHQLRERVKKMGARATLVNAWASWCGPCRTEFPMLVQLKEKLRQRGVEVVFVSVDDTESRAAALKFARENGETRPLLFAQHPLGTFKRALHEGWPGMLPATFLYDGSGELRHFWGGPVYEGELMPTVDDLLAGKPVDGASNFALIPGKDLRLEAPSSSTPAL